MLRILASLMMPAAFAAICWYLAHQLYLGLVCFFPGIRSGAVLIAVCIAAALLVFGFLRGLTPLPKAAKHILGSISGYGMGIGLYLLLFTLAADILLLIPRLRKLPFTQHPLYHGFVTIAVLLLTALTCIGGFLNARNIRHVSYEIPLQGKQDLSDWTIAVISDLHLGAVGSERRLETIVDEINGTEPDVICIAGDFFDTDFASIQDPEAALQTLRKLNAPHGIYACLGNHDGGQTFGQMEAFLEQANIHLLEDTCTVVDDRLVLAGRLDGAAIGGYGDQRRKEFSAFFDREDDSLPVIVLDHNPANIDEYSDEVQLILCGHTHKGQIFPANLITQRMYTVDYGYYRKDAQSPHVVVTSGVGTWGMPMRVGTSCEVVTIHFTSS